MIYAKIGPKNTKNVPLVAIVKKMINNINIL